MFEFSDKKDREKFKKTAYGKKTNFWLLISALVALPFFVFEIIICFIDTSDINSRFLTLMSTLFVVTVAVACYFDGKRDGAIEQYKIENKKSKREN